MRTTLFLGTFGLLFATSLPAADLRLMVDLSEAPRGVLHNREELAVRPGPLTLVSAKWIPGEHSATAAVLDLSGLRLTANGAVLPWRHDLQNAYAFHVEIPAGVSTLVVENDYLAPSSRSLGAGASTTPRLAVLNWTQIVVYPLGVDGSRFTAEASVILPPSWSQGSALEIASTEGSTTRFKETSLELLMDQPVLAGLHLRRFDLTPRGGPAHSLIAAGDSPESLALSEPRLEAFRRLPREMAAITGVYPYHHYDFLLALTDHFRPNGLEHHQSSDNREPENAFTDDSVFMTFADLLPHEFFHSWNGKHRRPAGLLSPDYHKPMEDELLWVYEGLTEYYGRVLAARTGLFKEEEFRAWLADTYLALDTTSGRNWRPLQDTCDAGIMLYDARDEQHAARRGVDFYSEGALIWLDADTLIRAESGGKRSLDDFIRVFQGDGRLGQAGPAGAVVVGPIVKPYNLDEVLAKLNSVHSHDWAAFFHERLARIQARAPAGGIERGGWDVVYRDEANPVTDGLESLYGSYGQLAGVGFSVEPDSAKVVDVVEGSPAQKAGIFSGQTLLAVNGRKFSLPLLKAALKATVTTGKLELIAEHGSFVTNHTLLYHGGIQIAHLQRKEGTTDLLHEIVTPRAPSP